MNEHSGLTKELEFSEPWPPTKIQWFPKPEGALGIDKDLFATSSDILRLYILKHNEGEDRFEIEDDGNQCI